MKKDSNNKERIVSKALELFNKKGIEYVGMRELATELNTKLGNITYYFPTKEDLILRVSMDLTEANSSILQTNDELTLLSFLEMSRKHFEYQYEYRCVFLSFVNLIRQYKKMAERYKVIEENRKNTVLLNIKTLVENKYLIKLSKEDTTFLLSTIMFVSRFWISEAEISHKKSKPSDQILHYLKLLANILSDYSTAKGKIQIAEFLKK